MQSLCLTKRVIDPWSRNYSERVMITQPLYFLSNDTYGIILRWWYLVITLRFVRYCSETALDANTRHGLFALIGGSQKRLALQRLKYYSLTFCASTAWHHPNDATRFDAFTIFFPDVPNIHIIKKTFRNRWFCKKKQGWFPATYTQNLRTIIIRPRFLGFTIIQNVLPFCVIVCVSFHVFLQYVPRFL